MKLDESAGIAISPVAIELHCHLIGANDRVVWSVIFDLELLAEDLAEQGGMAFEKRANGTARKQTHRSDLSAPMAAFHPLRTIAHRLKSRAKEALRCCPCQSCFSFSLWRAWPSQPSGYARSEAGKFTQ
jgi:hypothetical protein